MKLSCLDSVRLLQSASGRYESVSLPLPAVSVLLPFFFFSFRFVFQSFSHHFKSFHKSDVFGMNFVWNPYQRESQTALTLCDLYLNSEALWFLGRAGPPSSPAQLASWSFKSSASSSASASAGPAAGWRFALLSTSPAPAAWHESNLLEESLSSSSSSSSSSSRASPPSSSSFLWSPESATLSQPTRHTDALQSSVCFRAAARGEAAHVSARVAAYIEAMRHTAAAAVDDGEEEEVVRQRTNEALGALV